MLFSVFYVYLKDLNLAVFSIRLLHGNKSVWQDYQQIDTTYTGILLCIKANLHCDSCSDFVFPCTALRLFCQEFHTPPLLNLLTYAIHRGGGLYSLGWPQGCFVLRAESMRTKSFFVLLIIPFLHNNGVSSLYVMREALFRSRPRFKKKNLKKNCFKKKMKAEK